MAYRSVKSGKNIDFQQLIRILKVWLGYIHLGKAGRAYLSLNQ